MKFKDIPAHESVKEQLRAMTDNDRIPHALLLEGPSGTGKFMLARALAQYIHCTNHIDGDSCGVCPACVQHQTFNHVDTIFSFPVIKMKNRSSNPVSDDYITQWRDFLKENPYMDFGQWQEELGNANAQPLMYVDESMSLMRKLKFSSNTSRYMVVVMWLPEKLKEECANKLLKLIEEPHDDTKFILVSNEPSKILPTIYSRLRRIEVKRLPDEVVASYLSERYGADPTQAAALAHLSEGSVLRAVKRMSTSDNDALMLQYYIELMRLAYQRKIKELKDWSVNVSELGREKLAAFLEYCERLTGENYIYNLRNPQLVYLDEKEEKFSVNFARFINERNVEDMRQMFVDARRDVLGNANAKIVMFDVAVRTIMLIIR